MRQRLAFALVLLSAATLNAAQQAADVQRQLVGNWRLVSFDNFDDKGAARPNSYTSGRIMYDAAGQMAAQLMQAGRKPLTSPPVEAERAAAYYIEVPGGLHSDVVAPNLAAIVEFFNTHKKSVKPQSRE